VLWCTTDPRVLLDIIEATSAFKCLCNETPMSFLLFEVFDDLYIESCLIRKLPRYDLASLFLGSIH
jgi:hypothetical protein